MFLILKAIRIYITGLYLCLLKYVFDKQMSKNITAGRPATGRFVNYISKKYFKLTETFTRLERNFLSAMQKY